MNKINKFLYKLHNSNGIKKYIYFILFLFIVSLMFNTCSGGCNKHNSCNNSCNITRGTTNLIEI